MTDALSNKLLHGVVTVAGQPCPLPASKGESALKKSGFGSKSTAEAVCPMHSDKPEDQASQAIGNKV